MTTRMLLASALLAAVVGAAFALLLLAISGLRTSADVSSRSSAVAETANELRGLAVDLPNAARGFIISGDPVFLEPWHDAQRELPAKLRELRSLVTDPAQQRRATTLATSLDSYVRDWNVPLVATARRDRDRAAELVATGEGKRRFDTIRAQFDRFLAAQDRLTRQRAERAERDADRAVIAAATGLTGSIVLIVLFALYLARAIALPVREVASAAGRLGEGELSARAAERGTAEVATLARTFNTMAASLEESRDELESQNAELELQAAELEDRHAQLEQANDELDAQRTELERTVRELAAEKERVDRFYEFAEVLASRLELEALADAILRGLADVARAEVGALYALGEDGDEELALCAARGLDVAGLPATLPHAGLARRAFEEGRPVVAAYGDTALRLPVFGQEVAVRAEVHLPLVVADRTLALLTLGRAADREFGPSELDALEHLAAHAAVALSNALAYREAQRLAIVNRAVLEASAEGIALTDLEGNTVVENEAMRALSSELLDSPDGRGLFEPHVAHRLTDPGALEEALAAIEGDPDYEGSHELELADAQRRIQFYTAPVRHPDGGLLGRIFAARDVTRERQAERLKSELMATVSHELRTPLASIVGFSELLVHRPLEEQTRNQYLRTIHGEARRLAGLINDFLDLQRIEEGALTLALEPFELAGLLEEQVRLFSGQSEAHTIELTVAERPLPVAGDADRIRQVVANLLSNAIKYSPAGGRVDVTAEPSGRFVRVSVRDEGIGIPAEQQSRLFTKFFRVDSSDTRRIGGTGLGLALAREIVEAHGGQIGFDSVAGEGSTFWFELAAGTAGLDPARPRVLLVEDEDAALPLADELSAHGYDVGVATTPAEGIRRALGNPPAAICFDISLADGAEGWDALARLKESPVTAHVPVVVCTSGGDRRRATALGAADVLVKPFSSELLRETISRVVPPAHASVLVVDDEEPVRRLVAETLTRSGMSLREASDGAEALAAIATEQPDAIVLDLSMPRVDGFAVLDELRSNEATRTIPVVVLTARNLTGEERDRLSARTATLLEKSTYSLAELRRLVDQAIGLRHRHRPGAAADLDA